MILATQSIQGLDGQTWPTPPESAAGRVVVLHTRVVSQTGGGPDKTILLSASYLADTPYWLAAAYMYPQGDIGFDAIRKRAAAFDCPLIGIPDKGPLDRTVLRQLYQVCRTYNVRIWHAHDYKSNLFGLTLRPFWNMKLVTTLHGWVKQTSRTPLYYAIDRWCLPYYHHVFAVSDDLLEQARKLGVTEPRSSLLLNGVDEKVFSRKYPVAQSPLRQKYNVPPGRLVIGGMGRLSAEKAFNHLIDATHRLLKSGLDVELWIAGEGDARPDLQKLIKARHLEDRIRLLGFCDDTVEFYHGLDMFVLSSLREGLPNVVLEAMSMGLPVVSTQVAGIPKLVSDGVNGLLCPAGNVDLLTAAMQKVARDKLLREQLSQAARATIEERFTFRERMNGERAIYDRILADRDVVEPRVVTRG